MTTDTDNILPVRPCCNQLQEKFLSHCSKVNAWSDKNGTFILHDGEGRSREPVSFCPYCGTRLEVIE